METCVNKRLTIGAPGREAMEKVIAIEEEYLTKEWEIPGWEDNGEEEE
jgi:argininosuccinate lyase